MISGRINRVSSWILAIMMAVVVVLSAPAASADPLEPDEVSAALITFLSGATSQGSPVANSPQIVDLYYPTPTELTVFFVARSNQGRLVPGTVRAVYTASERWLWTSGSYSTGGLGGYAFRNPAHFGRRYEPVQ